VPTYAIGDIQGCDRTFSHLLKQLAFDPERDRLWIVGDMVNRGPASLDVLRRLRDLGPAVTAVLGNHDLYLLARFAGLVPKEADTLEPVLDAPDALELRDWLRARPLAVFEDGHLMVHAGVLPDWSLGWTLARARQVEAVLRGARWAEFVQSSKPGHSPEHETAAVLTRLRMVDGHGKPEWKFKAPPEAAPDHLRPWFESCSLIERGEATLLFGHWAALGFRRLPGAVSLDSGCAWGKYLTAYRLEDGAVFTEGLADLVVECD
jgi:bis(5'-nucleosyl)-tetraphosphatase (symmetrical)